MPTPPLPPGPFATVVADPPWQPALAGLMANHGNRPYYKSYPAKHYPTLPLGTIAALSPPTLPQAHLYLWSLAQHVDWAYHVARAWGFEPLILWTWKKPGVGTGRFQCNTEHVLVARKGSRHGNPFGRGGRFAPATNGTLFVWPRAAHSTKPEAFFQLVEALSPAPYLEMFARRLRPGWVVWGDEVS